MRRNDFSLEYFSLVSLLELRPGEVVLDAQSEPDALLPILYHEVTERGRVVGMAFGQHTFKQVRQQLDKMGLHKVELYPRHPTRPEFRSELFHAVVLRTTLGLPNLERPLAEMRRIAKPGARCIARHTQWTLKLPRASELEEEMMAALQPPCCEDGRDFFRRFESFTPKAWRDVRYDVFTIATRDPRASTRYNYDWRTLMRDQLLRTRQYTPRQILDLIDRLEHTRGAKVVVDRYLALGIKP